MLLRPFVALLFVLPMLFAQAGQRTVAAEKDEATDLVGSAEGGSPSGGDASLRVSGFDIDVTPPVGFMMAYDPVRQLGELGLRCRGMVLFGAEPPIVLCAVDWIGIGNEGHDVFRSRIAKAVGT